MVPPEDPAMGATATVSVALSRCRVGRQDARSGGSTCGVGRVEVWRDGSDVGAAQACAFIGRVCRSESRLDVWKKRTLRERRILLNQSECVGDRARSAQAGIPSLKVAGGVRELGIDIRNIVDSRGRRPARRYGVNGPISDVVPGSRGNGRQVIPAVVVAIGRRDDVSDRCGSCLRGRRCPRAERLSARKYSM